MDEVVWGFEIPAGNSVLVYEVHSIMPEGVLKEIHDDIVAQIPTGVIVTDVRCHFRGCYLTLNGGEKHEK